MNRLRNAESNVGLFVRNSLLTSSLVFIASPWPFEPIVHFQTTNSLRVLLPHPIYPPQGDLP